MPTQFKKICRINLLFAILVSVVLILFTHDTVPASYYFRINGEPIFFRGANLIPFDSITDRVTKRDRKYILEAAVEANFNAVRIWGGGLYQPDDLYDAADKIGLLVWQEIMLAVSFNL